MNLQRDASRRPAHPRRESGGRANTRRLPARFDRVSQRRHAADAMIVSIIQSVTFSTNGKRHATCFDELDVARLHSPRRIEGRWHGR